MQRIARWRPGAPCGPSKRRLSGLVRSITFGFACSFWAIPSAAERLPLKFYTTTDGLPHNEINRIVRDSRGFLWFCTRDGLARFDGYTFTSYGMEHGLPSGDVTDLLEDNDGRYWVATAGGLVRFDPAGVPQDRVVANS